jgi:hypothetical protein
VNEVHDLQEPVDHEWSERHVQVSPRSQPIIKEPVYHVE